MPKSTKNPRKTSTEAAGGQALESFVPLYLRGVELVAELQKKSLEAAAEQNAEFMEACKKTFSQFVPAAQIAPMFDLAAQAFDTILGSQKEAIDLVVEQNHTAAGFATDGIESVSTMTSSASSLFEKSVEYSVAAQKKALDVAAEQSKAAYETLKRQFGISGTPAAESFQRSLDALVETQKKVLDIASKPLKATAAA